MNIKLLSVLFTLVATAQAKANIYDLATPLMNKNCQSLSSSRQGEPGIKYVQCKEKVSDSEVRKGFLIVKSTFQELPDFIKNHFETKRADIKEWDQVYISISTENDDVALFGLCKARDSACSDDAGYTVGSAITVGAVYQGQYDVQMKVANALYTKVLPNSYSYDATKHERSDQQYFRSALVIEFLANSARQRNLSYWSLGTGIIGLSSQESFGILDAARNQQSLHRILNSLGQDMAIHHANLNDGQPDQWGFYLLAGLGVQKFLANQSSTITSRSYAQITTRASTLAKHSELRLELGSEVGHKIGASGRASIGGDVATTFHGDGQLNEATVYFKYESGEKWESSLGFTCQRGSLPNFSSYNNVNTTTGKPDCLYKLSMKYYIN